MQGASAMKWITSVMQWFFWFFLAVAALLVVSTEQECVREIMELLRHQRDAATTISQLLDPGLIMNPVMSPGGDEQAEFANQLLRQGAHRLQLLATLLYLRVVQLSGETVYLAAPFLAGITDGLLERRRRAESMQTMHPATFLCALYLTLLMLCAAALALLIPRSEAFIAARSLLYLIPFSLSAAIALYHRTL